MLLEQIERSQRKMQENLKQAQASAPPPKGSGNGKTIAIRVPDPFYKQLEAVKERFHLKSMKAALFFVAKKGIEHVMDGR